MTIIIVAGMYLQVGNSNRCWQTDKLIFEWELLYLSVSLLCQVIFTTITKSRGGFGHFFLPEGIQL